MSSEKVKAMNFPISMITIGNWTFIATNPDDIVAKFYFAKKKLLWEFLFDEEPRRLKRKIEMEWDDVSSFEERIASPDENGILKIELSKCPKFYIENNPQAGKHTQWKQTNQDFTGNQAYVYRVHTLHINLEVLQENLEKLLSHSFWSKLHKVYFRETIYFDIDYGSNNNTTNNSSHDIPSQTPHEDLEKSDVVLHHATANQDQTLNPQFSTSTSCFNENTEEQDQIFAICESFCVTDDNNKITSLFSSPISS